MGKRIFQKIKYIILCLLDVIFPKPQCCISCGKELKDANRFCLCLNCMNNISRLDSDNSDVLKDLKNTNIQSMAVDEAYSSCLYEGLVRNMVHRLKYKDKRELAISMAVFMEETIKGINCDYNFIVPVPISKKKLKKRGYNHAEIIARELKELLNIPVLNCIERIKDTSPQILFNGHDRWYNVKDCFKCTAAVDGKKILLIDDIITTGATVHYCAEELKCAGASCVTVLSFAKSNM